MKRIAIAVALSVLLLTGCGSSSSAESSSAEPKWPVVPGPFDGQFTVADVVVDGRTVTCVVWDGFNAGGISCDWANAKPS